LGRQPRTKNQGERVESIDTISIDTSTSIENPMGSSSYVQFESVDENGRVVSDDTNSQGTRTRTTTTTAAAVVEQGQEDTTVGIPSVPPPKYLPPEPPIVEENGISVESRGNEEIEIQSIPDPNTIQQDDGNSIQAAGIHDATNSTLRQKPVFGQEKKRKNKSFNTKHQEGKQRRTNHHDGIKRPFRMVKDNLFRRPDICVPDVDAPKDKNERKRLQLDYRKFMFWRRQRKVLPQPKDEFPPWTEPYQKQKNYQENYGLQ